MIYIYIERERDINICIYILCIYIYIYIYTMCIYIYIYIYDVHDIILAIPLPAVPSGVPFVQRPCAPILSLVLFQKEHASKL